MIDKVISFFFGTKHERDVKRMKPIVRKINEFEQAMKDRSTEELRQLALSCRERARAGEDLDKMLPEVFALVREVSVRTMGMRHFDVQMMGGIVLHEGRISEMKTGEGKTLVATLPVCLNALAGKGVHVVTVNDYLARRDAEWMTPIYNFMGLSVGIIQHDMRHEERKRAYACDIVYGTNNEFGFDYLRDNMVEHQSLRVQRALNYGIVDEVDSILIDEARTPLIISGSIEESTKKYQMVDKIIPRLKDGTDYEVNEKDRNVVLTEDGVHRVEELLNVTNLYDNHNIDMVHYVNQALRAHTLFKRDVDYMVQDDQVIIIDEFTGRLMQGRRYSDGLHQALEAKEGVAIARESQTLASITFQNFFRMYSKLSGMTGTADTEAVEFKKIYGLDVVVIPTNVDIQRIDKPDLIYKTEREKINAIVADIERRQSKGQPVLVGTVTIEKSELVSAHLKKIGIAHNVLNAKYHEREAAIVAEAGRPGQITIATNMAGRGTDIVLGGRRTYIDEMEHHVPVHHPELWEEFRVHVLASRFEEAESVMSRFEGQDRTCAREVLRKGREWLELHNKVLGAGGLYILGTERHEARRIDNQLRGRSGRQGDPGESRFYLSLEDNLMRVFGSERIYKVMDRLGMEEGQEIESKMVSKAIESAQKRVEGRNFEIRKHLLEYDDVMNSQREYIYGIRNNILEGRDISATIREYFVDVVRDNIENFGNGSAHPEEWELDEMVQYFERRFDYKLDVKNPDAYALKYDEYIECLADDMVSKYKNKGAHIGEDQVRSLERLIALQVIDTKWRDHLLAMDHLRDGIWTVGYSQRNPLVEYKLRGFEVFNDMLMAVKREITEFLMRVQVREVNEEQPAQYRHVGHEVHAELDQFSAGGGIPASTSSNNTANVLRGVSHSTGGYSERQEEPVTGGVNRKKTRRNRRG